MAPSYDGWGDEKIRLMLGKREEKVMDNPVETYREAIDQLAKLWISSGLPSRQAVAQAAAQLIRLRNQLGIEGLWAPPPLMVTATLDDGLGQGLEVIEAFAAAMGIRLVSLGLMQSPETITAACRRDQADYLGMTVLQFDSEDDLIRIAEKLPSQTRIIAGGSVFSADAEFAQRTGVHYAAKNVAYFLSYMLHEN